MRCVCTRRDVVLYRLPKFSYSDLNKNIVSVTPLKTFIRRDPRNLRPICTTALWSKRSISITVDYGPSGQWRLWSEYKCAFWPDFSLVALLIQYLPVAGALFIWHNPLIFQTGIIRVQRYWPEDTPFVSLIESSSRFTYCAIVSLYFGQVKNNHVYLPN